MVLLYLQYYSLARELVDFFHTEPSAFKDKKSATCAIRHCCRHWRQFPLPSKTITAVPALGIMVCALFVNPLTNPPCCSNKRLHSKNSRWMDLGAGEVGTHGVWSSSSGPATWCQPWTLCSLTITVLPFVWHFLGQYPDRCSRWLTTFSLVLITTFSFNLGTNWWSGVRWKNDHFSNGSYDQCKYPDPLIYTPIWCEYRFFWKKWVEGTLWGG